MVTVAQALNLSLTASASVALVSAIFMFTVTVRERGRLPPAGSPALPFLKRRSVQIFAASIATAFLIASFADVAARSELRGFLQADRVTSIAVNGKQVADPKPILNAIRSMHAVMAHHSHPTTHISVELANAKGAMKVLLRRDSDEPQEYWVSYPGYPGAEDRIVTSVLDDY